MTSRKAVLSMLVDEAEEHLERARSDQRRGDPSAAVRVERWERYVGKILALYAAVPDPSPVVAAEACVDWDVFDAAADVVTVGEVS